MGIARRRLSKVAMEHAIHAPLGVFLRRQAWRTSVTGVAQGAAAVLLGGEQDGARLPPTRPSVSVLT
jgi:hypothetical protein